MQSKEKRKINPRRRLLMRLIVTIFVIATLLVLGLRALKPKGAQIVYIAHDENGYDAIWLADLNDPENPRQLTFHEESYILYFQVSQENSIVFYRTYPIDNSMPIEFWTINLNSGLQRMFPICDTYFCPDYKLSPDGKWLTFEDFDDKLIRVVVQNLQTLEQQIIFETERGYLSFNQPFPCWIGNTSILVFRTTFDDIADYVFYDIKENRIVETFSVNVGLGFQTPYFSDDGSFYSFYSVQQPSTGTQVVNIQHRDNPINILHQIHSLETSVLDWHDESVLIVETRLLDNRYTINELNIYNLITGENEILINNVDRLSSGSFNADGTQLLYSVATNDLNIHQLMLFDMETREEITLPIVGRSPKWVNGGR